MGDAELPRQRIFSGARTVRSSSRIFPSSENRRLPGQRIVIFITNLLSVEQSRIEAGFNLGQARKSRQRAGTAHLLFHSAPEVSTRLRRISASRLHAPPPCAAQKQEDEAEEDGGHTLALNWRSHLIMKLPIGDRHHAGDRMKATGRVNRPSMIAMPPKNSTRRLCLPATATAEGLAGRAFRRTSRTGSGRQTGKTKNPTRHGAGRK